ncbi:phosphoribosyltransferase-like protein [Bradyrhizobium sp. 5.13L]
MNASISEENFLGPESFHHIEAGRVENLVLLDDVIGTGHQAADEIERLAVSVLPLGVKNIFVLSVCGMKNAIEEIEEKTKAFTFSAFEYNAADTASSLDSPFYAGVPYDERLRLKNRLKDYGRICYKSNPLGYGDLAGLLVLPYNTPNFTLPIVWSDNNEWIPLFRRVRKVNGISAYYKQFKQAVEKKTHAEKPAEEGAALGEVTLFVEGKRDEAFFDELVKRGLAEQIGAKSVSVVSLGSNVAPERLAELLASTTPNAVFVVDDDRHGAARAHERLQRMAPVIFLKPSYFQFFDLERLREVLPEEVAARLHGAPREVIAIEVERNLVRTGPIERSLRLTRELIERYIDWREVDGFVEQLRGVIGQPRGQATEPTTS